MKDLLLLLLLQLFWSSSYVAMKLALAEMPLGLVMILRYSTALLALALAGGFRGWTFPRRTMLIVIVVGLLDFSLSPFFQLSALQMTTATDVAILVAFEPMMTTLLAVVVLKEHLSWPTILAFLVATSGVLVMSHVDFSSAALTGPRLVGNGLFLLALLCESVYSVTSRHTTQQHHPLHVITLLTLAGTVGNLALHFPTLTPATLGAIGVQGWGAIGFLGICCSAIGYGGWTYLTKRIPIKWLTLSLFLQPVIGSVVAYLVLGEVPTRNTVLGAGMILACLLLWTWWHLERTRRIRYGLNPSTFGATEATACEQ